MEISDATLSLSAFGLANSGGWEWIGLFIIILVIFGPKRLPQLARSLGKSITDFKRGLNDVKDEIEKAGDEQDKAENNKSPENKSEEKSNSWI